MMSENEALRLMKQQEQGHFEQKYRAQPGQQPYSQPRSKQLHGQSASKAAAMPLFPDLFPREAV